MGQFDNIEFQTFDYDGFKTSLFDLARTYFPNWTDTLESNQGIVFVEWLAYIAGNLTFMQNFQARQCFVPTVTEAKNLTKLAKQYDYSIPSNVAAGTDLTISEATATPFPFNVVIAAGTQFKTSGSEPLIFETLVQLTILAGATSGIVAVKHQETKTESDTSDASSDFSTRLTYGPYIEDSIAVEVNSVAWTLVDNFLDSSGTDEHYRIEVDSEQIVTVIFGDGVNGKIPVLDAIIDYTYKVGGGEDGNVSPATITVLTGTLYDVGGNPIDVTVTNVSAAEGGVDREAVETTKLQLPPSLSAKSTTVSLNDFESRITGVAGISRVNIQTVNDNPDIPENTVIAIVLPDSADTVSGALQTAIDAAFAAYPTTLTLSLMIVNPQFITVEINVRDLALDAEDDDGTGTFASATVTIINNTFNAGDKIVVNGVDFEQGVDWTPGGTIALSATALALAITNSVEAGVADISASAIGAVITIISRTKGQHGNEYTLTETDGATNNFTLSGATFSNGTDGTVQALIRTAVDDFFGRTNVDAEDVYTVGFGETVYRNKLIWLVQEVEQVLSFTLQLPAANTTLEYNEFPKYHLIFTTT